VEQGAAMVFFVGLVDNGLEEAARRLDVEEEGGRGGLHTLFYGVDFGREVLNGVGARAVVYLDCGLR